MKRIFVKVVARIASKDLGKKKRVGIEDRQLEAKTDAYLGDFNYQA